LSFLLETWWSLTFASGEWGDGLGVGMETIKLGYDDHCTTINVVKFIELKIKQKKTYLLLIQIHKETKSFNIFCICHSHYPEQITLLSIS